jgi:hypothetical protein
MILLVASGAIGADNVASNAIVNVTAKITELPEPYVFPACACGEHLATPYTCEVTIVTFALPKDLEGKTLSIYHTQHLPTNSVWKLLGASLQFSIDPKALGSLYPQSDKRHTGTICYSSYVHGDPKVLTKTK